MEDCNYASAQDKWLECRRRPQEIACFSALKDVIEIFTDKAKPAVPRPCPQNAEQTRREEARACARGRCAVITSPSASERVFVNTHVSPLAIHMGTESEHRPACVGLLSSLESEAHVSSLSSEMCILR